jgi:hypothetical protein
MGFVMVQFSAVAYSPRLVLWLARDRTLFHALGRFRKLSSSLSRPFDRGGNGMVPPFSLGVVGILIIVGMLMFSRLMQRLSDLQISNVLHLIGDQGRVVIRDMFPRLEQEVTARASETTSDLRAKLGPRLKRRTTTATRVQSPSSTLTRSLASHGKLAERL